VRADALLTRFLQTQPGQRLLIATPDDLAAVYATRAIEMNRRQSDCVIVLQRHLVSRSTLRIFRAEAASQWRTAVAAA